MRRLAIAALGLASCLGSLGDGSVALGRGPARDLGIHATQRPADTREEARLALAEDARRREARFLEAVDPGYVFRASRPLQTQLDVGHYDNEEVFAMGGQLFELSFTPELGYGGADLPILSLVHDGLRGGPDARRCADCHHVGGLAGAGTTIDNAYLRGDGSTIGSAIVRNPPSLAGAGIVELLARQLTADLQQRRNDAVDLARDADEPIRVPLQAQGIEFGYLTVRPDGTTDERELAGVDDDLTIRPFGRKGRWATLRDVIEDELLIHHGMQTEYLAGRAVTDRIGSFGRDDPDGDGVTEEITEGQLTSLTFFVAMLDVPQSVPPTTSDELARWAQGEADFEDLGCAGCHVPRLRLDTMEYRLPSRHGGPTRRTFLDEQATNPRLEPSPTDGERWVWLYSDLRRHDMGPALAELRPEGAVAGAEFLTPPLWGVGTSAPYLHDGRAATLDDAILAHGGEAEAAAAAFAALDEARRAPLRVFLTSLRRAPKLTAR